MIPADGAMEEPGESQRQDGHPYRCILVALDGSSMAEQALTYVEPLVRAFSSRVICLSAVEPIDPAVIAETSLPGAYDSIEPVLEAQDEIRTEDASYLARLKVRLARRGVDVEYEEPEGRAAEAIVEAARRHEVDLIAMTTHARGGLGRVLLGSVAREVVHHAPCPVLLVRLHPNPSGRSTTN